MRILVIEDERKTAAFVAKGLQEAGFQVEIATDGETALERATSQQFDLAIVDVMLPKRDGWNVVRELRKTGWNKPIIFLTARDSVEERVHGLELGA
ncbi:MAG TPA: response regulator, partial [Chthoniobacterales bacterium]